MNRRIALKTAAFAAALCGVPWSITAEEGRARSLGIVLRDLPNRNDSDYWARLRREQFFLPDDRAFLNNGSLGVVPRPVMAAVTQSLVRGAEYRTDDVERWGYEPLDAERSEMSAYLGCDKDELAFTHNCTEGMNFIANGLDLKPGSEVLITNQEHGGGSMCWHLKAARCGTRLREVEIPVTPKDPGDLTDRLISAIGPNTRVLSFSGLTTTTGCILPIREICKAAREKEVLTVVDAAHMTGQVPMSLNELGCDFCAGSPHKWMFAPAGCGYLYGRAELLEKLWPTIATGGWEPNKGGKSARFMMVGTNNRATIDGMIAGLRFLKSLEMERVHRRMRELTDLVLQHASQRNYIEVITPRDRRFFQAIVSLQFKTENVDGFYQALKKAQVNVSGGRRIRVSCHVHTRPEDLELLFSIADRTLA